MVVGWSRAFIAVAASFVVVGCSLLVSTNGLDDAGGSSSSGSDDGGDGRDSDAAIAPSPDASHNDATTALDGTTTADGADAGLPFCASHVQSDLSFCEDFESDGQFARWVREKATDGGVQGLDTLVALGTRSLRTELPAGAPANSEEFLKSPLLPASGSIHFEASFQAAVTSDQEALVDILLQDDTHYGELSLLVSASSVEINQYWSGCSACSVGEISVAGSFTQWSVVTLDIELAPTLKATFTLNGVGVGVYDINTDATKLTSRVDVGLWAFLATNATTHVNIDNVVLTAK